MTPRGRAKLNQFKTLYKLQKDGIERILRYFYHYEVKELFKLGKLSYGVEDDKVIVEYLHQDWHKQFIHIVIDIKNRRRSDELRIVVQDFIVDTFFDYERTGEKMENKELARLFWVSPQAITNTVAGIKKKIKSHGNLLWFWDANEKEIL